MELTSGDLVGEKYRIERLLGRGGMGSVYVARDEKLHRQVALKVLDTRLDENPEAAARFRREAIVACKVDHPNVIEVYDADIEGGAPYIAMQLLRGESLEEHLRRRGHISEAEACWLAHETLAALEEIHAEGIVHRDLKPGNIFLEQRRRGVRLKVLDFGIARGTVGSLTSITRAGGTVGTPWYMPPEQLMAETDLDGRTDLFALGVILFEALAGHRPWDAGRYEQVVAQILASPAPELRASAPQVSEPFAAFVERALSRDRGNRHGSAAEMLAALERVGVPLRPLGSPTPDGLADTAPLSTAVGTPPRGGSPEADGDGADASGAAAPEGANDASDPSFAVAPTVGMMATPTGHSAEPAMKGSGAATKIVGAGALVAIVGVVAFVVLASGTGDDAEAEPAPVGSEPAPAVEEPPPSPASIVTDLAPGGLALEVDGESRGALDADGRVELELGSGPHRYRLLGTTPATRGLVFAQTQTAAREVDLGAPCPPGYAHVPVSDGSLPTAPFCIARREVTVSEYGGSLAEDVDPRCNSRDRPDHPVNCITYGEAQAHCQAEGGRLPTESEWEYAARGLENRDFPWGDDAPNETRLWWSGNGSGERGSAGGTGAVAATLRTAGASPFGAYDLAGNVAEWTEGVLDDGAVVRGGSWADPRPEDVEIDRRITVPADSRSSGLGFRCVHDVAPRGPDGAD